MLILRSNPTLADYQDYVTQLVEERGFADETVPEIFILLVEEVGEMVRYYRQHKSSVETLRQSIADEVSDSFTYLLDLANHFGLDVEQIFRKRVSSDQLELGASPTLEDYQRYVAEWLHEHQRASEDIAEALLFLVEEVGELARAVRKAVGIKIDAAAYAKYAELLPNQVARCLLSILNLANCLDIDAEQAFRRKEEKNKARLWARAQELEKKESK